MVLQVNRENPLTAFSADLWARRMDQRPSMIHEILPVGMLACNCSVVADEATREAVVIDPGDDIERVQEGLARHHLRPKYIIATHAHIDHVGGIEKLKRATGAAGPVDHEELALYQERPLQSAR